MSVMPRRQIPQSCAREWVCRFKIALSDKDPLSSEILDKVVLKWDIAKTLMAFKSLFIGIDKYQSSLISDLCCSARDAKEAFEIYDAIGYDWRAGRAALGLSRILKNSAPRKNTARKKLQHYPLSWLAAQLNGGAPGVLNDAERSKNVQHARASDCRIDAGSA
jgi:hypothetical protein